MTKKLIVEDIEKWFTNKEDKYKVLDNVSFELCNRELLSIVGPSGCGKTTLLRLIAGFEKQDKGSILIDGKSTNSKGIRKKTESIMIFQDFNQLFPWKSVIGNLVYPLKINGIGKTKEERIEIGRKYLKIVQLEGFESNYPHQLSGGMKQKVSIARALSINPNLLLMDEPFGSLDALTRNNLQEILLKIKQRTNITILFVTHDINEAIKISDRILVMNKGRILKIFDNTYKSKEETYENIYNLLY